MSRRFLGTSFLRHLLFQLTLRLTPIPIAVSLTVAVECVNSVLILVCHLLRQFLRIFSSCVSFRLHLFGSVSSVLITLFLVVVFVRALLPLLASQFDTSPVLVFQGFYRSRFRWPAAQRRVISVAVGSTALHDRSRLPCGPEVLDIIAPVRVQRKSRRAARCSRNLAQPVDLRELLGMSFFVTLYVGASAGYRRLS